MKHIINSDRLIVEIIESQCDRSLAEMIENNCDRPMGETIKSQCDRPMVEMIESKSDRSLALRTGDRFTDNCLRLNGQQHTLHHNH